ncbi:hypothetical protein GGR52DRAFT_555910 [Hypoxylon sp. FL1284]|nr:hypothetical protein GGR52DRAFT_555910 [Hypoxylon sp. FL1284]
MKLFRRSSPADKSLRQAPPPSVPRLARYYQLPRRHKLDLSCYPARSADSVAPSIHDLSLTHNILANGNNFANESKCKVLDIDLAVPDHPVGSLRDISGDPEMLAFTEYRLCELTRNYQGFEQCKSYLIRASLDTRTDESSFVTLKPAKDTSFGLQMSLSKDITQGLLSTLRVSPQFCSFMLGEPDYWSPLKIHTRKKDGSVGRTEFICQHPRYAIRQRQEPCSVWLAHDIGTSTTTYIITPGENEDWVERARSRMSDYFIRSRDDPRQAVAEVHDPFLLQSVLCHENLVQVKTLIAKLRRQLYDVLDIVGEYSKEPFDRKSLKDMTEQLHVVSQDADSFYSSAEMGFMVIDQTLRARNELCESVGSSSTFTASNVCDALDHLAESLKSWQRWLRSYKSRKDTAMNLVFNLVTQQDAETSTRIARDTKDDSASMKIIAVLTMIFLPATAVSGFFSMAFFSVDDQGVFISSVMAWLFAATTVPLTILIFMSWLFWYSIMDIVQGKPLPSSKAPGEV